MSSPSASTTTHALDHGENRSRAYTVAAILNLVTAVGSIAFSAPLVTGTDAAKQASGDQAPTAILIAGVVLGVLGLVSSYGVWRLLRWGVILTIVLNVLQILSSLGGIIGSGTTWIIVSSVISLVVSGVTIWLLWRKPATA